MGFFPPEPLDEAALNQVDKTHEVIAAVESMPAAKMAWTLMRASGEMVTDLADGRKVSLVNALENATDALADAEDAFAKTGQCRLCWINLYVGHKDHSVGCPLRET